MPQGTVSPRTAMDYRKRICRAMNYISGNLDRAPALEEVADAAAFSAYHFHRIFKAVVGETVAGFTRRLRLERAANHLLSNRHEDITTIAFECGFSSSQNFAKAFRAHFGVSPTVFRNSKNGNTVRNAENALSLQVVYDSDHALAASPAGERRHDVSAEVREMPELQVAFVRKMGPYSQETYDQGFGELMPWAGPRGYLATGAVLCVYWDNPEVTPPDRCRVDVCVEVPMGTPVEGAVGLQTVQGGLYAACHFEIRGDEFHQAWDDAFAWLVDSGYECDDVPCYELYHGLGSERHDGKWDLDICIPLKAQA